MEVNEPTATYRFQRQRTELGELPADWRVTPLGAFDPFITSGSRGWAAYYSEMGSPFLRITNLSRSRITPYLEDLRYVSIPRGNSEGVRTALAAGDVLISITADIGIVGFVDEEIGLPAYINQHIALVRLPQAEVNPRFVAYYLGGAASQARFKAMTDAGAKAGMSLSGVKQVFAAIPPTLQEQTDIAQALTDADALIDSLEQLLTKKRQIKQGAMQELLTGKRRLPGFTKCWDRKMLSDVVHMKSGEGITSEDIADAGEHRCFGGNGLRGYTTRFTHDGVHALIGRQGALCGNVSLVSGRFFASEHAIVVSPIGNADVTWLYYELQRMNLNRLSESSAQPGLSVEKLKTLEILVPDAAEQQSIAVTLADLDQLIAAIESRLAKARDLKQAMAQALLTGRIRLVEPQAA